MPRIINVPKMVQRTVSSGSSKPHNIKPTLETKPDVIDISTKPKDKTSDLMDLFDLTMTSLGLIIGVKKILELPPIKPDMTLMDINEHFKDIFLNDNISLGETKVMINRYSDIEQIEDDEEYMKELFREARANYGLEDTICELKLVDEISKNPNFKTEGFTDPLGNVTISMKGRTREQLFNTVHHELRHVKQHIYAFNYAPETYVEYSQPNNMELPKECFEYFFGCKPSQNNIPKSQHKFAKKCVEGMKGYKAASKGVNDYSVQFVEKDAYSAGDRMSAIMEIAKNTTYLVLEPANS